MKGTIYDPVLHPDMFRRMTPEYRELWKKTYQSWIDKHDGRLNTALIVTKAICDQAREGIKVLNEIINGLENV